MSTPAGPIAHRLAPALLAATMALAAWNWYLLPERAAAWAAALAFLAAIAVVFGIASRAAARASTNERSSRRRTDTIRTAVVFTTLLLAFSLAVQAAMTLGAIDEPELARRSTMVFIGIYFVLTGNQMPKTLPPLSAQCDGSRMQSFQRFTGWTWVLMGLSYAACWLLLPIETAKPVSVAVAIGGMAAVGAQIVRLRRMKRFG